jgi:glutaminyl-peptide cyclotransferase
MKNWILSYSGWLLLAGLTLIACNPEPKAPDTPDTPVVETPRSGKTYQVPRFSQDSAYAYIAKQVAFGPRVPNTSEHEACGDWMADKLRSFGLEVIEQTFQATAFDGTVLNGRNIIGQYNPGATNRILFAAHWDTRPFADSPLNNERMAEPIAGADDGGSGVGVLLEIARQLQANPIDDQDLGVDIVFFDAEDYGESGGSETTWCLGSQHWARNLHRPNYRPKYGILLDMVGSATPRFTKDKVSMTFAPQVMNKVWKLAQAMGHGNLFVDIPTGLIVDDHYFVNQIAKIPMIDVINKPAGSETGFGDYWHTHDDDMDVISKNTLRAVGQVMVAVIYREASGSF